MTLGEIIFQFPNNIKIIIRQLEKLERKQVKANMAILFNRTFRMYIFVCFVIFGIFDDFLLLLYVKNIFLWVYRLR